MLLIILGLVSIASGCALCSGGVLMSAVQEVEGSNFDEREQDCE